MVAAAAAGAAKVMSRFTKSAVGGRQPQLVKKGPGRTGGQGGGGVTHAVEGLWGE